MSPLPKVPNSQRNFKTEIAGLEKDAEVLYNAHAIMMVENLAESRAKRRMLTNSLNDLLLQEEVTVIPSGIATVTKKPRSDVRVHADKRIERYRKELGILDANSTGQN